MQESDWESFVDTLVGDTMTDGHAQNVQSPLSVVCDMPPAYYWQPLIALPPMAPMSQNVQPANQQPHPLHQPLPPPQIPHPPPPTPLATPTPLAPPAPPPPPPPPPSPLQSDRMTALKEEARATVEAITQRKTKRCNKEKLDRAGRVIVKCRYGTKCRFVHQGERVQKRTPAHVIERMVDAELAHMLASMKTK